MWYGWPDRGRSSFKARDLDDVWEIPRPKRSPEHPTMKPVELVARAIRNSSMRGDRALDPFAGSGSTIIVAQQTGRHGRAIEIDPHYAEVTIRRWEAFSGQTAELING
jgi:DNA modification methylase